MTTLNQLFDSYNVKKEDREKWRALIHAWLNERHKQWQGENAPYDEIGELLAEVKQ